MTIKRRLIIWLLKKIGFVELVCALQYLGINPVLNLRPEIDERWFSVFEKMYSHNGFLTEV